MTDFVEEIPAEYLARPQAYIKHLTLKNYLDRLFRIISVGMSKTARGKPVQITFIDCFAGPWQATGEKLEATSVSIAVTLMKKVRSQLGPRYPVKFTGVFLEPTPTAFESLNTYLESETTNTVQLVAINGEFPSSLPQIMRYCTNDAFCFFFVDPFGFQGVMPEDLQTILRRPNTELLINLMSDYVNRFKRHPNDLIRSKFEALMGGPITDANVDTLSATYATQLQRYKPRGVRFQYNAVMPVLMPGKFRRFYDLVYVTHHPLGLIEFKEVTEHIHKEQLDVWAQAQHSRKSDTLDLFGLQRGDVNPAKFPLGSNSNEITEKFLAKLNASHGVICFNVEVFAQMLIEFDCLPTQLQWCIKNLIESKLVRNPSIKRNRSKYFVDYQRSEFIVKYDYDLSLSAGQPTSN
jgi:three-Cys-motif partner protein